MDAWWLEVLLCILQMTRSPPSVKHVPPAATHLRTSKELLALVFGKTPLNFALKILYCQGFLAGSANCLQRFRIEEAGDDMGAISFRKHVGAELIWPDSLRQDAYLVVTHSNILEAV